MTGKVEKPSSPLSRAELEDILEKCRECAEIVNTGVTTEDITELIKNLKQKSSAGINEKEIASGTWSKKIRLNNMCVYFKSDQIPFSREEKVTFESVGKPVRSDCKTTQSPRNTSGPLSSTARVSARLDIPNNTKNKHNSRKEFVSKRDSYNRGSPNNSNQYNRDAEERVRTSNGRVSSNIPNREGLNLEGGQDQAQGRSDESRKSKSYSEDQSPAGAATSDHRYVLRSVPATRYNAHGVTNPHIWTSNFNFVKPSNASGRQGCTLSNSSFFILSGQRVRGIRTCCSRIC
jgi:hypothetical protein